jgi:hypothetical protein
VFLSPPLDFHSTCFGSLFWLTGFQLKAPLVCTISLPRATSKWRRRKLWKLWFVVCSSIYFCPASASFWAYEEHINFTLLSRGSMPCVYNISNHTTLSPSSCFFIPRIVWRSALADGSLAERNERSSRSLFETIQTDGTTALRLFASVAMRNTRTKVVKATLPWAIRTSRITLSPFRLLLSRPTTFHNALADAFSVATQLPPDRNLVQTTELVRPTFYQSCYAPLARMLCIRV